MFQRRDYNENEKITVGFKANGKLTQAIHAAAAKVGAQSTSQYLENLVTDWVAAELGVSVESLRPAPPPPRAMPSEAAIATARLEQTIADAQAALDALRREAGPRRRDSGFQRRAG